MKLLDIKEYSNSSIVKKCIKINSYYDNKILSFSGNRRLNNTKILTYDNNFIGYYNTIRFLSHLTDIFIYVDPDYRNSGYGKLLLEDIILNTKYYRYSTLILNTHITYTTNILYFLYSNRFRLFDPLKLDKKEFYTYGKVCIDTRLV